MKTAIIVQARTTSTRLPGKVLLPLAGRPMLARLLERLAHVRRADLVLVATTTNRTDDPIAELCDAVKVDCFRGSETDVLGRYAGAARACGADTVVRVTSDCPLLDPAVVDEVITAFQTPPPVQYASNMLEPTYPLGMAVEAFDVAVLREAHAQAIDPAEREHVTPFIYWRPQRYHLRSVRLPHDHTRHRWTVDTAADYELVKLLFETLHAHKPAFTLQDLLDLAEEHPAWEQINQGISQHRPVRATGGTE
jgi:spore coat polysaccharide biosynthesis protein SpsF